MYKPHTLDGEIKLSDFINHPNQLVHIKSMAVYYLLRDLLTIKIKYSVQILIVNHGKF